MTAPGGDWYDAEQPTRRVLVAELQRIRRRTRVRPLPVVVAAALITAGITHKIATKPVIVEANVVLALAEGSLASRRTTVPVDQLRTYVTQVLLPDQRLLALVEKYDLFPLRTKAGPEFALDGLRGQFSVEIWKNSFVNYDDEDSDALRSARIGISVRDLDPDRAIDLARDLAGIVIETATNLRKDAANKLTQQVDAIRQAMSEEIDRLTLDIAGKKAAIDEAIARGQDELVGVRRLDLAALEAVKRDREDRLAKIAASPEALAGPIAEAGLDMTLSVVDESRPQRPTHSGLVLVMIAAVIGTGALLGCALVLGAFDSRVHDLDDVARLGLPVLGHVPGFAGDHVGSMQTRSAGRARVPSFRRWRSHR